MGRGGLSYGTTNFAGQLADNNFDDDGEGSEGGDHDDTSNTQFDPTNSGNSAYRLVTIKEELSAEEQKVFTQKIADLTATNIVSNGVTFKAVGMSNFSAEDKVKVTDSRGIGNKTGYLYLDTSKDYASYNGKTVLPCASMIECLIYLNTKIKIKGSFDFSRGWIGAGGNNLVGGTLNDHVCGRGIDITHVGLTETSMIDLTKGLEANYRKALDLILATLDAMDPNIHPDLLSVDDRLGTDYGIAPGSYEINPRKGVVLDGIIQKKYKSLKRIDFHPDKGHRDHIHLAFGPERAGTYLNWTDSNANTGSTDTTVEIDTKLVKGDPKVTTELFKSFYNTNAKIENTNALYRALIDYGDFSPEVAAIFMCIAERESNFGPSSVNFGIEISGDYSPGLFQINFFGNQKWITQPFTVTNPVGSSSPNPFASKKIKGYELLFKDWKTLNIKNIQTAVAKMREVSAKEEESTSQRMATMAAARNLCDPRLFVPIVQILFLKDFVANYTTRYKFTPWGEYSGGPQYGWIHKLKFNTAVQFYVENNPGKTKEDLIRFCKPMIGNFLATNTLGKANYLKWLNGEVFG